MFLCSSFCKTGQDDNQIQIAKVAHSNKWKNQLSKQTLEDLVSTFMFKKSKYEQFKDIAKMTKQPFIDKEFPPNSSSLNYKIPGRQIIWKRATEVVKNCLMVQKGINPADIQQGNIGDCYFMASISAIAEEQSRIKQIFHQNFQLSNQGIYRIIAVKQGMPFQMVIDDFIPVYKGTDRPVFCRANGRQIWVMLLEKAWAKIKGSYGNISSGNPHEVLNTFSTAPCSYYYLQNNSPQQNKDYIWQQLIRASKNNLPVCAGTKNNNNLINGLRPLHTYTILNCGLVTSGNIKAKIMKLRNPWGSTQYSGFGSENDSGFWGKVTEPQRAQYLPEKADDGIFTIPFEQFYKNFQSIDICNWLFGYNYEFKQIQMTKNIPYCVFLQVKQQHEAYIGFQKQFEQSDRSPTGYLNYGYSKILIGKQLGTDVYQYYTSKLQTSFPDINKQINLKPGRYVIICQSDSPHLPNKFNVTFSYYYRSLVNQENKKLDYVGKISQNKLLSCLQSIFLNHAFRLNDNKQKLGSKTNDWIASQLLFDEGGYGYVACNLQKNTTLKLQIAINYALIKQKGYQLLGNYPQQLIISAGESRIFIFTVNFQDKSLQNLQFPPSGFKLTKIA